MDAHVLLARLAALVPVMAARAAELDETARFPTEDVHDLRHAAVLLCPVPVGLGGLGIGTDARRASAALELFRLLGRGNLALGRLVEAHVNALRLAFRYGDAALCRAVAEDAAAGHLCGLWVTDPPDTASRGTMVRVMPDGTISGSKQFCSGAGHVTRAVVTVFEAGQTRLAYVALDHGIVVRPLPGGLSGMRAALTGQVTFDNAQASVFGGPGDYLREPDFSCGAWRTSAATLGGLEALTEQFGQHLRERGRGGDAHQQARFGQAMIAAETARLWMVDAAVRAEADHAGADAIAYVGLARLAVERACLEVIALVQRSLGVTALMRGAPVERLCRDLSTYLRQPAADMVLTEAAASVLQGDRAAVFGPHPGPLPLGTEREKYREGDFDAAH